MSLNQINKLLETLVEWFVWNGQIMDELIGLCSTRTEENGALLGGCVNVVGSKVLLETPSPRDPVQKARPFRVSPFFALHLHRHFVVSAPRRYGHLHAFQQRYNNTTSNRAQPHSANTALDTRFLLRMHTIHVSLT